VRDSLRALVGTLKDRIAVACFASNIARLETITHVAMEHGRQVALVGRSLWRMVASAQENGYLKGLPEFIAEHDVGYFPRDKILMICTGSQGEPRSALSRIAHKEHPHVTLEPGDAVIFSSRTIPGNEKAIARLQNELTHLDVRVITDREEDIHVSGHPARDELTEMYQMIRPQIAIPVHGEARHIKEHVALAKECQVPHALEAANGAMIRLAPGAPEIVAAVPCGRLGLDGKALVRLEGDLLRHRHRMSFNGLIMVSVVLDKHGKLLAPPQVSLEGLLDGGELADEASRAMSEMVSEAVGGLSRTQLQDTEEVTEACRLAARRWFNKAYDKKPVTKVHLVRL
jgi:ribonuclease J